MPSCAAAASAAASTVASCFELPDTVVVDAGAAAVAFEAAVAATLLKLLLLEIATIGFADETFGALESKLESDVVGATTVALDTPPPPPPPTNAAAAVGMAPNVANDDVVDIDAICVPSLKQTNKETFETTQRSLGFSRCSQCFVLERETGRRIAIDRRGWRVILIGLARRRAVVQHVLLGAAIVLRRQRHMLVAEELRIERAQRRALLAHEALDAPRVVRPIVHVLPLHSKDATRTSVADNFVVVHDTLN